MNEIYSRCGYRCDLCPAFERNQTGPQDRERVSAGWEKYYNGFHMDPGEIVCAGCPFEGHHIDGGCTVRPCANARGCVTCADCSEYGSCDMLNKKLGAIQPIKDRHGNAMPPEDYRLFIAPYEAKVHLEQLRKKPREGR